MTLALVLATLAARLATGVLIALPLVPLAQTGRNFFRLNALGSAILLALGGAVFLVAPPVGHTLAARAAAGAFLAAAVALGVLDVVLRAGAFGAVRGLAGAVAAVAAAGVALASAPWWASAALAAGEGRGALVPVAFASGAVASAALLGSVGVAMVLGHFYLILPRLSIAPLQRLSWVIVAALVVRAATLGLALLLVPDLDRFFARNLIFILQRVLFGIAGPALLSWWIVETARIRSTQSATGILYACLAMVLLAEASSSYYLVMNGIAL